MAFSLDQFEPGSLGRSLAQGKENARERGETPASFGYDQGSAQVPGPEFGQQRFAGDVFKGLGVEGVFGQMSNDRQNVGPKQPSVVHEPVHKRIVLANSTRTTNATC